MAAFHDDLGVCSLEGIFNQQLTPSLLQRNTALRAFKNSFTATLHSSSLILKLDMIKGSQTAVGKKS